MASSFTLVSDPFFRSLSVGAFWYVLIYLFLQLTLFFYAGEVLVVSFIVPSLQLVRGISLFHSPPISFMLHGLLLVFLLCTHFEVG